MVPAKPTSGPQQIACGRCGAALVCEPMGDCWCKHEPVRLTVPTADAGCLCANCLRDAAAIDTSRFVKNPG